MQAASKKKLLILGGSSSEIPLIARAMDLGIYTIATDSNTNHEISPAKELCDEYWDISWADIDKLKERCLSSGVGAVLAGYSEVRVEHLIELCSELQLPCYISYEQLQKTRDKKAFKALCQEFGVPTIKEYGQDDRDLKFPVIVKPVDRGGSIGISIANNAQELERSLELARANSAQSKVIIEEYREFDKKVDVYYSIKNGRPRFLGMSDTIHSDKNDGKWVIQNSWVMPSVHTGLFLRKEGEKVEDLIASLDVKSGFIFLSGFLDEEGDFSFFECGLRLSGGQFFNYFKEIGTADVFKQFINYAFSEECGYPDMREASNLSISDSDLYCIVLNYYLTDGIIDKIIGFDEISSLPDCKLAIRYCRKGQRCASDAAILDKAAMFHVYTHDLKAAEKTIGIINESFSVISETGDNMVFDYPNPAAIVAELRPKARG